MDDRCGWRLSGRRLWSGRLDQSGPGHVDGWATYVAGVVWAMGEDGHRARLDLLVDSTVPLGAGLSSSAALECATAVALAGLLHLDLSPDVRRSLARACMRAESEVAGAPTGGWTRWSRCSPQPDAACWSTSATTPNRRPARPRRPRAAGDRHPCLARAHRRRLRRPSCGLPSRRRRPGRVQPAEPSLAALTASPFPSAAGAHHMVTEIERVADAVQAVKAEDWVGLGRLFLASHASLRDDFEVSSAELDAAVQRRSSRCVSARMTRRVRRIIGRAGASRSGSTGRIRDRRAFEAAGFAPPPHLLAPPSDGRSADPTRPDACAMPGNGGPLGGAARSQRRRETPWPAATRSPSSRTRRRRCEGVDERDAGCRRVRSSARRATPSDSVTSLVPGRKGRAGKPDDDRAGAGRTAPVEADASRKVHGDPLAPGPDDSAPVQQAVAKKTAAKKAPAKKAPAKQAPAKKAAGQEGPRRARRKKTPAKKATEPAEDADRQRRPRRRRRRRQCRRSRPRATYRPARPRRRLRARSPPPRSQPSRSRPRGSTRPVPTTRRRVRDRGLPARSRPSSPRRSSRHGQLIPTRAEHRHRA